MSEKYELVKFADDELELEVSVSPKEITVWLTQKQMAILFNVSVDNISLHIKNILKEELDYSVVEESSLTASDGKNYKTKLYHLGHSIKDLGMKIFSISESDSNIIPELLKNI